MNAKELIEAATHFVRTKYCECDHDSGVFNCMGCDIDRMASHILATVREDDGEPVTVERMDNELGWKLQTDVKYTVRYKMQTRDFGLEVEVFKGSASFWVDLEDSGLAVNPLRSMGHLRRLVAALGE
jgi:hypothetical protein